MQQCEGSSPLRADHILIGAVDGVFSKVAQAGQAFRRASAFLCTAVRTVFTVQLRTTQKLHTSDLSEKLCLEMNGDNFVDFSSWHCASEMQSESKLGLFDIFYFSCKCIIYPRIGVFGILHYQNVHDLVGPRANI